MTNQEAIDVIKGLGLPIDAFYTKGKRRNEVYEALEVAIKALEERPPVETAIKRDVWELYERYQPRLATNVYEFGVELKELLNRYGSDMRKDSI